MERMIREVKTRRKAGGGIWNRDRKDGRLNKERRENENKEARDKRETKMDEIR